MNFPAKALSDMENQINESDASGKSPESFFGFQLVVDEDAIAPPPPFKFNGLFQINGKMILEGFFYL